MNNGVMDGVTGKASYKISLNQSNNLQLSHFQ